MINKGVKCMPMVALIYGGCGFAADADEQLLIGLGGMVNSGIYREVDAQFQLAPILIGRKGNVRFNGDSIGYELFSQNGFYIAPLVSFALGQGFKFKDIEESSTLYSGYDERDMSIGAGIEAGYNFDSMSVAISALGDISDTHSGYSVQLNIQDTYIVGQSVALSPQLTVTYNSDKVNQYYYGIDLEESNARRPIYTSEAGVNVSLGVMGVWNMNNNWNLLGGVSYTLYSSEVTDSPIVSEDGESTLFLGVGYSF